MLIAKKGLIDSFFSDPMIMTTSVHLPSKKTIIGVALMGCLLTSLAGVTAAMLISGWNESGDAQLIVTQFARPAPERAGS
jgi:hypothetical protein